MIVILGSGLTGLVSAYELSRIRSYETLVLEKEKFTGGSLSSFTNKGYSIEKFYHHFFTNDHYFRALLDELGLSKKVLWKGTKTGFYSGGKIYNLSGIINLMLFSLLSPAQRMKMAVLGLKVKTMSRHELEKYDRISAAKWVSDVAGKDVYTKIFEPILRSKYGPEMEKVSAAWLIERLKMRSSRGLLSEKLGYVSGGFSGVIKSLEKSVTDRHGTILANSPVKKIGIRNNQVEYVAYKNKKVDADCVISTIPPSELLRVARLGSEYAKSLKRLEYQGCVSVMIGLDSPLSDFYWTNIIDNGREFGAVVEHSNMVPCNEYRNECITYLASYPPAKSGIWKMSSEQIFRKYMKSLQKMFPEKKIKAKWWKVFSTRHAGLVYRKGILSDIERIKNPAKGLFAGGMFTSYPERSMELSVKTGMEMAKKAERYLCFL